ATCKAVVVPGVAGIRVVMTAVVVKAFSASGFVPPTLRCCSRCSGVLPAVVLLLLLLLLVPSGS
nr:hypothetical protein [Tanacetum cinerariifolium]